MKHASQFFPKEITHPLFLEREIEKKKKKRLLELLEREIPRRVCENSQQEQETSKSFFLCFKIGLIRNKSTVSNKILLSFFSSLTNKRFESLLGSMEYTEESYYFCAVNGPF